MALHTSPLPAPEPDVYTANVAPLKYISIKRSQACSCCNRVHEYCELYAYYELKSTLGFRRVYNLHRIAWPRFRVPIEQWENTTSEILPWCHDCNEPSLDQCLMDRHQLLDPPAEVRAIVSAVFDAREAKAPPRISGKVEARWVKPGSETAQTAQTKPLKSKRSADSLMEMLK